MSLLIKTLLGLLLAYLLLVIIPFVAAEALLGSRPRRRVAAAGAACLLAILLAATEARGALLPSLFAMASSGFDYLWIEMQHSPLTYQEVARMIWACRGAPAMPFIRVPDSTPGDIQKAMDIGALGIIIPLVDSV